jgi:polyadenylate-binding protein
VTYTKPLFVGRAQKRTDRDREMTMRREREKMERVNKMQGCNLYVRNLDESVTEEELSHEFAKFGAVTSARISKDAAGRSKLFGFVCFSAPDDAARALQGMNGTMFRGKPLFVALWQPKEVRAAAMAAEFSRRQGAAVAAAAGFGGMPAGPGGPAAQYGMAGMYFGALAQRGGYPGAGFGGRPGAAAPGYPGAAMARGMMGMPMAPMGMPMSPAMAAAMQQQMAAQAAAASAGLVPAAMAGRGGYGGRGGPRGGMGGRGGRGGRGGGGMGRGGVPPAGAPTFGAPPAGAMVPYRGARPMGPSDPAMIAAQQAQMAQMAQMAVQQQMAAAAAAAAVAVAGGGGGGAPMASENISPEALAAATPEQQKHMIGERLYTLIYSVQPLLAGKITGMLLDGMDTSELLHLLESPEDRAARIQEALQVLEEHSRRTAVA